MAILLKRDDELVPVFYRALVETEQQHVARILGYEGFVHLLRSDFMCILFIVIMTPVTLIISEVISAA